MAKKDQIVGAGREGVESRVAASSALRVEKEYLADMIYDDLDGSPTERTIVDIADVTIHRKIPGSAKYRDLLVPIFRRGDQSMSVRRFIRCAVRRRARWVAFTRASNDSLIPMSIPLVWNSASTNSNRS